MADERDLRIARGDFGGGVLRAIVDYEDFIGRKRLREEAFDGLGEKFGYVVGGDVNGDGRRSGHYYFLM